MTFTLNFVRQSWPDPGPSLAELLAVRAWPAGQAEVRVNGQPVPEQSFGELRLADGDAVTVSFRVSGVPGGSPGAG